MLELAPTARLREIANASHDVHLDQPERWREILEEFLSGLA
jgi:pimeloyl-ACP methyl ester carboxylesterase